MLNAEAAQLAAEKGLTVSFTSDVASKGDPVTLTITGPASLADYQIILQGIQYVDTKTGAQRSTADRTVTVVVNDGTLDSVLHSVTIHVIRAPAGIAGDPINLGLADPSLGLDYVATVTVSDIPADWIVSGGVHHADGSWTVQTNDLASLSITTPAYFSGAILLNVAASVVLVDGTTTTIVLGDNVEAYSPGSPIFAWSGDDYLTASSLDDLIVFSQPIGHDVVYSFDVAHDQIDLIGYAGLTSFADVQSHLTERWQRTAHIVRRTIDSSARSSRCGTDGEKFRIRSNADTRQCRYNDDL